MFDLRSVASRLLDLIRPRSAEWSNLSDRAEDSPSAALSDEDWEDDSPEIRAIGPNTDNGTSGQSLFPLGSPFSTESSIFGDDLFGSESSMFDDDLFSPGSSMFSDD